MPGNEKAKKNSLTIRLTESAVFLRTNDSTGRNRHNDSRPSLLRGLLVLDLVKPTRIRSIELELSAKAATSWPEGIGARRIDVTEEHKIFSATSVFFRGGPAPRRTASIGPGVVDTFDFAGTEDPDDVFYPDTPASRGESARPPLRMAEHVHQSEPGDTRRRSIDNSTFQRSPIAYHEELPPIPPYSSHSATPPVHTPPVSSATSTMFERPTMSPTHSASHVPSINESPAQTLQELRNALRADLSTDGRSPSAGLRSAGRHASSSASSFRETSLSRRPSIEDVPENEPGPSTPRTPARHTPSGTPGSESPRSPSESRGRQRMGSSRFSLTSVSSALFDVVRSSSPRNRQKTETGNETLRGRTMEKHTPPVGVGGGSPVATLRSGGSQRRSKERLGARMFGEILGLDTEDGKGDGDGWKEFKKGTYTYPISFAIPGHAPPSLQCDYGSVTWRLKATVHRPGTFKAKLAAQRLIEVVSCPTEEDTEDTENIIVERHWDNQLQYLIAISGRSFFIGGTVPVTFTMMPLAKIKIHRISVFIEERVDYYAQFKRIARTDPLVRSPLLALKVDSKEGGAILPLDSDDPDAFKNSPLYAVAHPDDDLSEMASSLMGPGPWSFHQELQLPDHCRLLRPSNKNRRSNITVNHVLKCVLRVERGDDSAVDERTGKRKLFDIVVQTPVQILSCRCNPEWTSLPNYSEAFQDPGAFSPQCPCMFKRAQAEQPRGGLERMFTHHSSDSQSSASAAETSPVNPATMRSLRGAADSMLDRNAQYEQLVSGRVNTSGEAPPAYYDGVGIGT